MNMKSVQTLAFAVLAFGVLVAIAAKAEGRDERTKWWSQDRFGLFIHFGIYSQAARHEKVLCRERQTDAEYRKYFDLFSPDLFDAREWARIAKVSGMKYAVLTAKHHDGFCLWDSKFTDYKVTNTPFRRDVVREFVEAFRAEGLRVGIYYSLLDWHHPDFTIDNCHPRWDEKTVDEMNVGRNWTKYQQYMKDQIRELLSEYGEISIAWFDYSYPKGKYGKGRKEWDSKGIVNLARGLQPGIILDNRLDLADDPDGWDFVTPEQFKVAEWPKVDGKRVPWETCQTFSGSWGYYRDEHSWKDSAQLIELLVESVSKGGNVMLNVGPTGRGDFDDRALARLSDYAKWMDLNGCAIYGCTEAPSDLEPPDGTVLTWNPQTKRLYVHLLEWPIKSLPVKFWERIAYAQFLYDGSEVLIGRPYWKRIDNGDDKSDLRGTFELPVVKPEVEVPVIEVFLK